MEPLVVDGATAVEIVADARDLEWVEPRAVLQHPFVRDCRHDVGVGQDAEFLAASPRQLDLENAVIHVAIRQPEVRRDPLDQLAELDDRLVLMRRNLVRAHRRNGHHLLDGRDDMLLVAKAVVQAEQATDVDEVVAGERGLGLVGGRAGFQLGIRLRGLRKKRPEIGRDIGLLGRDQLVELGFLERLCEPRLNEHEGKPQRQDRN